MYGRSPNPRFISIFDKNPELNPKTLPLPFSVALLVKLCIVAAIEARQTSFGFFSKTAMASKLCADTLGHIRELFVDSAKVYEEQNRQVTQIIDLIQESNEVMLPALVNPEPILSQPRPKPWKDDVRRWCEKLSSIVFVVSRVFLVPKRELRKWWESNLSTMRDGTLSKPLGAVTRHHHLSVALCASNASLHGNFIRLHDI